MSDVLLVAMTTAAGPGRPEFPHPLAPLVALPGVAAAAERARDALAAVHRHPANLRGWSSTAMEASWRGARCSAAIDGGSVELRRDGDYDDPLLAGAALMAEQGWMSPAEIAEALNLSVKTVSVYRARLLEKMNLRNNAELTHYGLKHGLAE